MIIFSIVSSVLTCIACGLGLSMLNGGPLGNRLLVELRLKLGVVQSGVCIGVLWLAAAVAPNKGDSDRNWVRGSSDND